MTTYAIRFAHKEIYGYKYVSMGIVEKKPGLQFYYDAIGCDTIDIVPAYAMQGKVDGISFCLVVDDEGLLVGKQINAPASILYGAREHGQPLVGNVLVCKDVFTPDGTETDGFTLKELETVIPAIQDILQE